MSEPNLSQKVIRHDDHYTKAQESEYFRFQYTHRHFYRDCEQGQVDLYAIQEAVDTVYDFIYKYHDPPLDHRAIVHYLVGPDHSFLMEVSAEADYEMAATCLIHESIAFYHTLHYGNESPYRPILAELDKKIANIVYSICTRKEAEIVLLHEISYTYGYNPILLLKPVEKVRLKLIELRQNGSIEFPSITGTFLRKPKKESDFFVRDLHTQKKYESAENHFLCAYLNVLKPEFSDKKLKQLAKNLSQKIIQHIDTDNCFKYGNEETADVQICIRLSDIDRTKRRWKTKLCEKIFLQILLYLDYKIPFFLRDDNLTETLYKISTSPYEQIGAEFRLKGLELWDTVNDFASDLKKPYPEDYLHIAIEIIEKKLEYPSPADERDRVYHTQYLLADLCVNEMDVLYKNQITDCISNHFRFSNR